MSGKTSRAANRAKTQAAPAEDTGNARSKKPKEKSDLAQLLDFAGNYKALTYLGCALAAVAQLLGFVPYICIWLVARDLVAVAPNWSQAANIAQYAWVAVAFAVLGILVYFCALMCTHLSAFRCATNIRKTTSDHLMTLPLGYFDTHATGELRRIIDGCASNTETMLAHNLPDLAGSVAMVLGMLVVLFVFDWRLGLACMAAIVVSVACMAGMFSKSAQEFMKYYQDATVKMSKAGTEYVRGIPVVKVFQQTVYSFKAFHEAIAEYEHNARRFSQDVCMKPQVANLTVQNGMVAFLVPVILLLAPGEADLARFLTNVCFYAIFSAVIPTALAKVMFASEAGMMASDAMGRVKSVLTTEPLPVSPRPKTPQANDVVFDEVTFTYEGGACPALDHVSFTVPAGATVALVGPSGSGKSTCASLVPRFWDADTGSVRVGGVDVRDMDPHALMDQVAFVFQTNKLFRASLADNVRSARPEATDDEVKAALHAAQCDDIVEKLPRGIHTMLGTGGAYLSGGEVQRVALARAILKNAPIVVLDEATAFADPENEALIQRGFTALSQGRTVLMIAHRLSTVVSADKIVVLNRGRVAEEGTHAELVRAKGLYARMWAEYEQAAAWKVVNTTADTTAQKGGEA